jgi:hypothetical protein
LAWLAGDGSVAGTGAGWGLGAGKVALVTFERREATFDAATVLVFFFMVNWDVRPLTMSKFCLL